MNRAKGLIAALCGAGVAALAFIEPPATTSVAAQVTKADGKYIKPCASGDYSDFGCRPTEDKETQVDTEKRIAAYTPDPVKYPVPRTKWDGKPDFSGVWWPTVTIARAPASIESLYRREARAAREQLDPTENPRLSCYPTGPTSGGMTGPLNVQLVHGPGVLVVMDEHLGYYRIIPTDGRPRSPKAQPSFEGDSLGHWEGDTLVVEVTNFNGKPRLGGGNMSEFLPQITSDSLHITERWTRPDGRMIEYENVVEDPKMLTAPWKGPRVRRARVPVDRIFESICIEDFGDLARDRDWFLRRR